MILRTLQLTNYKQYTDLTLDFREGLVGVIGKNGSGKSTLFEAILYCLFGRDESNKALVRSTLAPPKAPVELVLDFHIGEALYRVKREFRGKALTVGAELYKNDDLVAKGVAAVNDELVKVLHMERDAFRRSVFSGQKELSQLSDTSGEARKRMVRRMLGLDTLDEVQTRVNADMRDLTSQMAGQRQTLLSDEARLSMREEVSRIENTLLDNHTALQTATRQLATLDAQYRTLRTAFEEEEQRAQRYHACSRQLAQVQERQQGLMRQQEQLRTKYATLEAQQSQQEAQRGEFAHYEQDRRSFDLLDAARQRALNRDTYSSQIEALQDPMRQSREKLAAFDADLLHRDQVEGNLQNRLHDISQLQQRREEKLAEVRTLEASLSALQERMQDRQQKVARIEAIGREGQCPTCFQPVRDAYDAVLSQLDAEIHLIQTTEKTTLEATLAQVIEAGKGLRQQRDEAEKTAQTHRAELARLGELARQRKTEAEQLQRLQTEVARLQVILREIGEADFDQTAYQQLREKLTRQEPLYRDFMSQENYLTRELPTTREALHTTQTDAHAAAEKAATLTRDLAAIAYDAARYEAARQALTEFNETRTAQSEQVRDLEKTGMEGQTQLAQLQSRLHNDAEVQAQISQKLEETELLRRLADMLGQFKTEILEKVSPGISREASDLFSRITKGKYEGILVDENFDFSIADGGQYYPMERFSGGEVDLANFCLRIAITKAIMELSGATADRRLEFLAFDEIFGSQDEERRLEMMLALNYLQEEFRQIYIVSHIESLKDYFPHLLEVRASEEGSTVAWR